MDNISDITRRNFSFAWFKFAKSEVSKKWYKDSFSYLEYMPDEVFKGIGKLGLDVGCGSGSDTINITQYGARVVGIDIHDSIHITHKNIRAFKNIFLAQADIHHLPFKDNCFDFVYCFGVLHHLFDPVGGFEALVSKVKSSGYLIIYVYEDFSQRSYFERATLKIVSLLRSFTNRLPAPILYSFCVVLYPVVLVCCSLLSWFLKKIRITRKIAERIPYRHTLNPECIISDLYDRFSPPIENRYSRDEVEDWFRNANFEDVNIINYRGWVAWGKKK